MPVEVPCYVNIYGLTLVCVCVCVCVCALSGRSAHCDVEYCVLLLKMKRCDDVLIEKPELVT